MTEETREYPDSSNIRELVFDYDSGELRATFAGGGRYVYSPVPAYVWHGLKDEPSIGKAFAVTIRNKAKKAGEPEQADYPYTYRKEDGRARAEGRSFQPGFGWVD